MKRKIFVILSLVMLAGEVFAAPSSHKCPLCWGQMRWTGEGFDDDSERMGRRYKNKKKDIAQKPVEAPKAKKATKKPAKKTTKK